MESLSGMSDTWFYQFLYESEVAQVDVCASSNKISIFSIWVKGQKELVEG